MIAATGSSEGTSVPDTIRSLIEQECRDTDPGDATLADFLAVLEDPEEVEVQFSGGISQTCWRVTRPNGPYQVIYLPTAGYFSLCVSSQFGPLDIGVHGGAIRVFSSV